MLQKKLLKVKNVFAPKDQYAILKFWVFQQKTWNMASLAIQSGTRWNQLLPSGAQKVNAKKKLFKVKNFFTPKDQYAILKFWIFQQKTWNMASSAIKSGTRWNQLLPSGAQNVNT